MDLLLAAKAVGPRGRAIGVDMTDSMRERAMAAAHIAGFENVEVRQGDAMSLPIESESVDVVISNGVSTLCPTNPSPMAKCSEFLNPADDFFMRT